MKARSSAPFLFSASELMDKPYKIPESVLIVIYTDALEVLLIERTGAPGFWQSVTGSRDTPDEPLRETARREVFEETGIVVARSSVDAATLDNAVDGHHLTDWQLSNVYEIYPLWRHRYAPGVTHNTEHVFGLLAPRDITVTLAPQEHTALRWLPYRAAADHCFSPSNAEAILQLPHHL
jgi:dATP pyrophosphohydrolase